MKHITICVISLAMLCVFTSIGFAFTCTWAEAGPGATAASAGTWNNCGGGAPGVADAVVLDGTSVVDITWDIAAVASVLINVGYTGTVNQNCSIGNNRTF